MIKPVLSQANTAPKQAAAITDTLIVFMFLASGDLNLVLRFKLIYRI
jgi:hypothetical protein